MDPTLHPDCAPFAPFLGTWSGEGEGDYPTIEPFRYGEEVRFSHGGGPFLVYSQQTWNTETGAPMHSETGYLRPTGEGVVEWVLVHPTGVTEVFEGTFDGRTLDGTSTSVAVTPSAKDVTALERTYELDGDVMRYTLRMAAVGVPMTHHLAAELRRTGGG